MSPLEFAKDRINADPELFFKETIKDCHYLLDEKLALINDIAEDAVKCALKWAANLELHTFDEKAEVALALISKKAACVETFNRIGLSDKDDMFKVASELKDQSIFLTLLKEGKFENPTQREELALKLAETNPVELLSNGLPDKFALLPESRKEFILLAVKTLDVKIRGGSSDVDLSKISFDRIGPIGEEELFAIACDLKSPKLYCKLLKEVTFTKKERCKGLGVKYARIDPLELLSNGFPKSLGISPADQRTTIAFAIENLDGKMGRRLDHFDLSKFSFNRLGLSDEGDLLAVARRLRSPELYCKFLKEVTFEEEENRKELAKKLAAVDPVALLFNGLLENIKVSTESRRELILQAAANLDDKVKRDLHDYGDCGLSDREDLINLLFILSERRSICVRGGKSLAKSLDEMAGAAKIEEIREIQSFLRASKEYGVSNNLRRAAESRKEKSFEIFTKHFLGFEKNAIRFNIRCLGIAKILDRARAESDERVASALSSWAHYLHLVFEDIEIPRWAEGRVISTLEAIYDHRKPELRYTLTDFLGKHLTTQQNFLDDFISISDSKVPAVFRPVLCELARQGVADDGDLGSLTTLLPKREISKDAKRRDATMKGLIELAHSDIDLNDRKRLLGLSLQECVGKAQFHQLTDYFRNLSVVLPFGEFFDLREKLCAELALVRNISDLGLVPGRMLEFVLGRENNPGLYKELGSGEFLERLDAFNASLKTETPIINYAINIFCGLRDGEEKAAVLAAINKYIDVTILADSPESSAEFLKEKNDVSASEHLQLAMKVDPEVTRRWLSYECRKTGLFANAKVLSPDRGNEVVRPETLKQQDFSQWAVTFEHHPEAYLGYGAFAGSCQNVSWSASFNKAVMGQVMLGRNRMLTVESPDRRMRARYVIRLGVDEAAQRLVVHLEGKYDDSKIPPNCNQVVLEFAKEVVRELGPNVRFVTHRNAAFKVAEKYAGTVSFRPDKPGCEWVDAEHGEVVDTRVGYTLTDAFAIDISKGMG